MLYPDITTFWQMIVFLVVYALLSRFLFRPFLRLQDLRDEATAATGTAEVGAEAGLSKLVAAIEEKNKALAVELSGLREKAIMDAQAAIHTKLQQASDAAAGRLAEAESQLDSTFREIGTSLAGQRNEFARQLVARLTA